MLQRLDQKIGTITAENLSEEQVYRRQAPQQPAARRRVAPGPLNCPICGCSAAFFLPFGLAGRRNACCPACGSLERHRFLWLYLSRQTRLLRASARLLHTAPEPCLDARLRALPNLRYRSVDRFDPAADLNADLCDLPIADGAVDLIISSHVLEHLPDDRPAVAELARVLRRGGRALIMVPYDPDLPATEEGGHAVSPRERLARFGHPYHYRNYGADFLHRLTAAGFRVTRHSVKQLFNPRRRRHFRLNNNHLFDCCLA